MTTISKIDRGNNETHSQIKKKKKTNKQKLKMISVTLLIAVLVALAYTSVVSDATAKAKELGASAKNIASKVDCDITNFGRKINIFLSLAKTNAPD